MKQIQVLTHVMVSLTIAIGMSATAVLAGGTDQFTIALEQPVSDGVPGPGAGNIESPGSIDIYTFMGVAGTEIFVDEQGGSCSIAWSCVDPGGSDLFVDSGLCISDPGCRVLPQTGEYTITVFGEGNATGTYGFTLWEVNPVQSFAISTKLVVSDGVPGPGAGNIEEPGTGDSYTFTLASETTLFVDELGGPCTIAWSCLNSAGGDVCGSWFVYR